LKFFKTILYFNAVDMIFVGTAILAAKFVLIKYFILFLVIIPLEKVFFLVLFLFFHLEKLLEFDLPWNNIVEKLH